jgi:hypothetical protein
VFDDAIGDYAASKQTHVSAVIELIADCFQSNSTEYRQNGAMWSLAAAAAAAGDGADALGAELSTSLCDPLATLKVQLILIERHLGAALFEEVWRGVARRIDDMLVRDIVLVHYFTSAGFAQFRHDMCNALWALWRPYTSVPHNHFPRLRDGLALLSVAHAPAFSFTASTGGGDGNTRDSATIARAATPATMTGGDRVKRLRSLLLASNNSQRNNTDSKHTAPSPSPSLLPVSAPTASTDGGADATELAIAEFVRQTAAPISGSAVSSSQPLSLSVSEVRRIVTRMSTATDAAR